jgi:hypothetical protein
MDIAELSLQRATWIAHAMSAMSKAKHCRYYATTPGVQLALGALLHAWQSSRDKSFTREAAAEFLEQLAPYAESLFQVRPKDEPEPADLDQFKDEFGNLPKNPWSRDSINITDQNYISGKFPAVAAYLKTVAEKGETFMAVAERKAAKEQRKFLRDLEYGEKQHKELNPYVNPDITLTERMKFEKEYGPDVAQFFRREAETPVQLPWLGKRNQTIMQQMQHQNPVLRAAIDQSGETLRTWAQQEVTEAESVAAAALAKREEAQGLFETKIKQMESALEAKLT